MKTIVYQRCHPTMPASHFVYSCFVYSRFVYSHFVYSHLIDSCFLSVMRKPFFCICENKDVDQLRSHCTADQRLCFRYTDSTIPLLPKPEISSLYQSSVVVQSCLCQTWSETPKTCFHTTRLIWSTEKAL